MPNPPTKARPVPDADLVLAIDTSASVSVGIARAGAGLVGDAVHDRMAHVEQLMPLVDRCLGTIGASLADVGHVVVGLGPGPFTGLRAGIVTAQMIAHVRGVPLHGVCSLDAIAQMHARVSRPSVDGDFVVASDARRREVYWARYAADGTRVEGPEVGSPDAVPRLPTVGPAVDLYPDRLQSGPGTITLSGAWLAAHGLELPSAGTEPLYLRRPDAAEPTRRKSVLRLPPGQAVRR
jgi:tRNA threonylcarbamoyl adenosine modification protein YeaZ